MITKAKAPILIKAKGRAKKAFSVTDNARYWKVEQIKKILIIQTAFIGDVILTTPLIRLTQENFKNALVHVLVIPKAVNLLQNNPFISRIICFDKRGRDAGARGLLRMIIYIRKAQYDLVISPHRSIRSALIAYLSGAKYRIGFNTSSGALLYNRKVRYRSDLHEVERNILLLCGLEIKTEDFPSPAIYPDEKDELLIENILSEKQILKKQIIGIAPGSEWATKRWPKKYFKEFVQRLTQKKYAVILVGSKEDFELCQFIAGDLSDEVINLAGYLSLRQSAALFGRCKIIVSNDSAPQHLAAAMNRPVVALFGPTVSAFGFYPYGSNHTILEKPMDCRPCGIHGGDRCPIGTHQCMKDITVDKIMSAVLKYMD